MKYLNTKPGSIEEIEKITKEELSKKDNFAFGVSVAGSILALGIVLTGAITGENAPSYLMEIVGMLAYGVYGLVLIKIGRIDVQ